MPGFLLHKGANVTCLHQGKAQPTAVNPRVKVSEQETVTLASPYAIVSACALPPPPNGNGPCATAAFVTAAQKVTSGGLPLLLSDSQALCAPSSTKLTINSTQTRVKGT